MGKALNINAGISHYDGIPPLSAFNIPVQDGLTYAGIFASGPSLAEKNYAFTGDGVVVGGAITGGNGYCTIPQGCYIDTGIKQTLAISMLAVFRSPDETDALGIMGDYEGAANPGVAMFVGGAQEDAAQYVIENDAGSTMPTRSLPNPETDFNLMGFAAPAVGGATVFTKPGSTTQATEYTRAITTSGNILLGGLPNAGFQQEIDLALAVLFDREITASEIDQLKAWAVEHMANYGIAI